MRKDKWLNGDLDRLPMLTWIMFLKFLDDLEIGAPDAGRRKNKGNAELAPHKASNKNLAEAKPVGDKVLHIF